MESAAAILKRAVEMDTKEQYTMALVLYQEGVRILIDAVKGIPAASPRLLASFDKKNYYISFIVTAFVKKLKRQ